MSTDSLICKVVEYDIMKKEINRAYIFYDHNLCTFGIRGGYIAKGKQNYSFYSNSILGVMNFIRTLFDDFNKLSICLVKYSYLSNTADDIIYDELLLNDSRVDEIVGYDYWKSKEDAFTDKKSVRHGFNYENNDVDIFLDKCLQSLIDVYNDY